MTLDAVEDTLDALSCKENGLVAATTVTIRLAFLERNRLLEHEDDLLPMRRLAPRTRREAHVRMSVCVRLGFDSLLVRGIREELGRAFLRRWCLARCARVVREEGIEPGDECSDLTGLAGLCR
jgi:hypothetical protein